MRSRHGVRFRPGQLPLADAVLVPDFACPAPIVVEGDVAEWSAAADAVAAASGSLLAAAPATVAIVHGTLEPSVRAVLAPFDLVADGLAPESTSDAWLDAFAAHPHAGTVLAHTLRVPPSLVTESLAFSMLQAGPEHARWLAGREAPRRSDPGPRVTHERHDGVDVVTLIRPERHNAIDVDMREQLCDVLDAITQTSSGPVLVVGDGPSFCSGGDLTEFGLRADPVQAHLVRSGRSIAARLERIRGRLVCAVHGACIGAGLELAAFAARVVATRDATFGLPEVAFGLLPGSGGTVSVRARAGRRAFMDLALTGRRFAAVEAERLGIVDEVCEPHELGAAGMAAAQALSR